MPNEVKIIPEVNILLTAKTVPQTTRIGGVLIILTNFSTSYLRAVSQSCKLYGLADRRGGASSRVAQATARRSAQQRRSGLGRCQLASHATQNASRRWARESEAASGVVSFDPSLSLQTSGSRVRGPLKIPIENFITESCIFARHICARSSRAR